MFRAPNALEIRGFGGMLPQKRLKFRVSLILFATISEGHFTKSVKENAVVRCLFYRSVERGFYLWQKIFLNILSIFEVRTSGFA